MSFQTTLVTARRLALGAVIAIAPVAAAQSSANLPPIRQVGRRIGLSHDTLGSQVAAQLVGVHGLSDGRFLVNDLITHRLVLFDSTLAHGTVVADSTPLTGKAYGSQMAALVPYHGDSSLFIDGTALAMIVVDPNGKMVRTFAPPRPADMLAVVIGLATSNTSYALDAKGRFLYRGLPAYMAGMMGGRGGAAAAPPTPGLAIMAARAGVHDSVALLRADMATHAIDTAAFTYAAVTAAPKMDMSDDQKHMTVSVTIYPIRASDEWAITTDGSVAIVRSSDYHIDWINPDGTRSSTPKIAHDWKRIDDDGKQALVDSMKHVADSLKQLVDAQMKTAAQRNPGMSGISMTFNPILPDISDVPDYYPPFAPGAVMADLENHVWIREGASAPSTSVPQVFDVVDRKGVLVDRVQLPPSLSLVGFGPNGVIYLSSHEASGLVLVKYRLK